ncbi:hypothetical protein RCO27_04170 [Sphingosinicella sp. LHD-64]|uniref:hypothetical protein n=1 Tax=Sphingosinicella sp. LHD-64 TaxID=3072139 RepID=UPI00280E06AF|nr:hypothetical protein [Sphingosinicella sp. LHD-64]MDQ8755417.1 hypothetical protein [Sphingosinicella sp. LHD-64]
MFLTALALATAMPPRPMMAEVSRDPITDQVRARAVLNDNRNQLIVACDPTRYRGMRVMLRFPSWFDRGNIFSGVRPFTYRFDANPPRRFNWHIQDDTATLTGRRKVESFVQWLSSSERLVIRARDVEERPVDLSFRIAGAAPALAQVREACTQPRRRRGFWWPFS